METFFINEAFEKAIKEYISSKEDTKLKFYDSFFAVIIRTLILLYGELDIINPYIIKDENSLYENMNKYNYPKDKIITFFDKIQKYLDNEKHKRSKYNRYFIDVQKDLIDMFDYKRKNYGVIKREYNEFFDLLYTPGTSSYTRLSYNYLSAEDIYEVAKYYREVMNKKREVEKNNEKINSLLPTYIYKAFDVKISDISKMNVNDIEYLNDQIYESLDIKKNAINRDYLLEKKVEELLNERNKVTTGNGYVDILLILSVIITIIMIIVIVIVFIF